MTPIVALGVHVFVVLTRTPLVKKVSHAVLICETFRRKRKCKISPKFARSDAVHRRGNRYGPMGTDARVRTLCVARKSVPLRARGEGRARLPLRQHPTPPRRRRRPRPHSTKTRTRWTFDRVPWVKNFGTLRPERSVLFETAR